MSGWGNGTWGSCDWGICDDGAEIAVGITEVNLFGVDLIEVLFGATVRNSDSLRDPGNWRIDLLSSTGKTVSVLEIQADAGPAIDRVYLVVTPYSPGSFYCVSRLSTVLSSKNETLTGSMQEIVKGRFTKADSLSRTRPVMYDLRPSANFRNVLNAIGRQDDLIGGSQNEGDEILPVCPPIS